MPTLLNIENVNQPHSIHKIDIPQVSDCKKKKGTIEKIDMSYPKDKVPEFISHDYSKA